MKKCLFPVLPLLLILSLILSACGTSQTSGKNADESNNDSHHQEKAQKFDLVMPGEFTFAASGEYRPFSYMEGSEMVGYDISVGQEIANILGLKPDQKKAKFATIVTGVQSGRYDAAVASHTITKKREKKVDFSEPYYYSGPVIFTRPGSDIHSAKDLKGKAVCVSRGSSYADIAKKYTKNVPKVDSDVVALQSLSKGHYDAVITDQITGQTAMKNGANIEMREQLGVSEQAIAVAKNHDKLLKAINQALDQLKNSGKLKQIAMDEVGVDITKSPDKMKESD